MTRVKTFVNNITTPIYSAEVTREGERAVDISKFGFASNIQVEQNDDIIFLHDIIDLDDLIACYTFEDHTLDESGNGLDGTASNLTYVNNKDNYGRSAQFNGTSTSVTVPHNDKLNFGSGEFAILWRGTFYSEPTIYAGRSSSNGLTISGDPDFNHRVGLKIKADNIGIGHKFTKVSMHLSKIGTPLGVATVGVMSSAGTIKSSKEIDATTITSSIIKHTFDLTKFTLVEGDIIFIEYTAGDDENGIIVNIAKQVTGDNSKFIAQIENPWQDYTGILSWTIGDNGSKQEELLSRFGDGTALQLQYNIDGSIRFLTGTSDDGNFIIITSPKSFADGAYHIVYIRRKANNEVELFVDNISQGKGTNTANLTYTAALHIGGSGGDWFGNKCSQVRLYSKALSDVEQTRIHTRTIPIHVTWFGGTVWKVEKTTHFKKAYCRSFGKVLGETEIRGKSYTNKTPEYIVNDIITNETDLTYIDNGVPSGIVLATYIADGKLGDIVSDMASVTNRTWKVDAQKNFFFDTLRAGGLPIVYEHGINARILSTVEDETELVNDLIVVGGTAANDDPVYVRQTRNSSIAKYGIRAKRINLPWLTSYEDGVRFVSSYLNLYSKVRIKYSIEVPLLEHRVRENDVVGAINTIKNLNLQAVVKSIKWTYPKMITELSVGEFAFDEYESKKHILEKIHDIESALNTVTSVQEYESVEEALAMNDFLFIRALDEQAEIIALADAQSVTEVEVAQYETNYYSGGTGDQDDTIYGGT